ncbi:MAG: Ig-like domain-containing protein [Bacteroidetes bacterium]|nr:Ig-like domain-containing protein [Bacteroidota bacterium]
MINKNLLLISFFSFSVIFFGCKKNDENKNPDNNGTVQLASIKIAGKTLDLQGNTESIPIDSMIVINFNTMLDQTSASSAISLKLNGGTVPVTKEFSNNNKTVHIDPDESLDYLTDYTIHIGNNLQGSNGESFPGIDITFTTIEGELTLTLVTINGEPIENEISYNVDFQNLNIEFHFSDELDPNDYSSYFYISGSFQKEYTLSSDHKKVSVTNSDDLIHYQKYHVSVSGSLSSANGYEFNGYSTDFFTRLDSTYKFPALSDDDLLTLIQQKTFAYFYDFAHPESGMTRERNTSGDLVTTGGSGFGVMSLIVGMERNFITRQEGTDRLDKILTFLETCERFHGAWPHWVNGNSGNVIPFSSNDDGADLVETSFMIQGLYTMRQYLDPGTPEEEEMINRINNLIDDVEWDWFTRDQNVLYWHWSPNVGWAMNMQIRGYNETLITYIMAAASTTHGIDAEVYHQGYAKNGGIQNGNTYYDYTLPLGNGMGGPLFFVHYSFLGLDPRNLQDAYAGYWEQNVNQSLINWAYCADNPKNFIGYSHACWGLTASDNPWGYNAHSPSNDLGVITPTAAVSSLPYTPEQSMEAIHHFYYLLGDRLWGDYGFYDAFDVTEGWWATSYLAIDQGPIVCMIENYRSGLLWDLFMSCPEVQEGLNELGFSF